MSRQDDPMAKLAELWTESARSTSQALGDVFAAFSRQLGAVPVGPGGPGVEELLAGFGRSAEQLSALIAGLLGRLAEDLPAAARERLDRQTFSQLGRLAADRLQAELGRLGELPRELFDRLGRLEPADSERLGRLLESMLAEYLQDLSSLSSDAFAIDVKPLADAFARVLSGDGDEQARKRVDRFLEALAVKARYGSEYYADPQRTLVGQSPRELVHRQGRIALYRYLPPAGVRPAAAAPVLLVYSVINKPYILDLLPGCSFVEHLLARGLDVYLIDWGEAVPGDRQTTLDDYIDPGIRGCVEHIRARTGAARVSLFGHCIGGNLALLYAALHPETVERLVTLTTPITAAEGGVVAVWTDRALFPVDAIVEAYGHMPAKLIRYTFMALKPYYEIMKWKMFLQNLADDRVMELFLPVDRWANENVDIPGEVFRKFVREVFHEGRFAEGRTEIHGRPAELGRITCPLLNLAASKDWIVPLASARVLGELVGSAEQAFVPIEGAHVGIMIDPRARKHWEQMSAFLLGASPARVAAMQPGSGGPTSSARRTAGRAARPSAGAARRAPASARKPYRKPALKTARKTAR